MRPRNFRGTTVVIIGAVGGLGSALCRRFGEAGAKVVALDLDGARAEALATRLRAQGIQVLGLACDVSDEAACREAIVRVIDGHSGIDVPVNNAGISARCLLRNADSAVVRRVMAVNFFGAVHATQSALESLIERRGQIVVISRIAGFSPLVGRTAYAASKHALHGFFDSLRSELRADRVDVLLACPAFIATGIDRAALGGDGCTATAPRQTTGAQAQPDAVAAHIVEAARRRRRLCLPATTSRLAWWMSRPAPDTYERLMLRRVGAEFDMSSRRAA